MIFSARHAMPLSGKTSLEKARQTHGIIAGAEVCGRARRCLARLAAAWRGQASLGKHTTSQAGVEVCQIPVRFGLVVQDQAGHGEANTPLLTGSGSFLACQHIACRVRAGTGRAWQGKHTASARGVEVCRAMPRHGRAMQGAAWQTHGVRSGRRSLPSFGQARQGAPCHGGADTRRLTGRRSLHGKARRVAVWHVAAGWALAQLGGAAQPQLRCAGVSFSTQLNYE